MSSPTMTKATPVITVSPANGGTVATTLIQSDAALDTTGLSYECDFAKADLYSFAATPARGYRFVRFAIEGDLHRRYWNRYGELTSDEIYPFQITRNAPQFSTGNTPDEGNVYQYGYERQTIWGGKVESCVTRYAVTAVFERLTPTYRLVYNQNDAQRRLCYDPATGQLIYDSIGT